MNGRKAFSLTARAFRLLWKYQPGLPLWTLLHSVLSAVQPYTTIYFSARVLGELAYGRDPGRLTMWVLLTLGISACVGLAVGGCGAQMRRERERFNHTQLWIFGDKMLSMDYPDRVSQERQSLYDQIQQTHMFSGMGLSNLIFDMIPRLITAAASVVCGLALSAGLFLTRVPDSAGWLTVLNAPVFPVLLLLAMVLLALLAGWLGEKGQRAFMKTMGEGRFGNRLFSYFGFAMFYERKRYIDMRLYDQCGLAETYMEQSPFRHRGPLAEKARRVIVPLGATAEMVNVSFTGIAYLFVGLKAWGGAFGVDGVTQYVGAVTALASGISLLIAAATSLRTNAQVLEQVFDYLDTPNAMYQGSLTTEKRADRQYQVEFRDVSFRYPGSETYALRHVNVAFRVGSRLAVVGENGSGKTTFIKLLCRLYDPTEGQILLNGIDIRKYRYEEYMDLFSVVFQDFQLPAFSLAETVAAGKPMDRETIAACLEKAGFGQRLATLPKGLDTMLYKSLEKEGVELSGGERQKVAIARALYKDAPFIILDEPTAALDPKAEAEIYEKFSQLVTDKTAIYISHRLSSCKFCDEIAVFDHGAIVQQGSHAQLLAQPEGKYAALWNAQAQYYTE